MKVLAVGMILKRPINCLVFLRVLYKLFGIFERPFLCLVILRSYCYVCIFEKALLSLVFFQKNLVYFEKLTWPPWFRCNIFCRCFEKFARASIPKTLRPRQKFPPLPVHVFPGGRRAGSGSGSVTTPGLPVNDKTRPGDIPAFASQSYGPENGRQESMCMEEVRDFREKPFLDEMGLGGYKRSRRSGFWPPDSCCF